jgi:hypothetical protein
MPNLPESLQRIDFVVAGVQKSGTTALDSFLRLNKKIQLPNGIKEIHFFDNEKIDWDNPNYNSYHNYFNWDDKTHIRGEVTPIYSFWPNSIERIKRYNPRMKIVILLRNPIFRAHSHWKMERARGREPLGFSSAIREGRNRTFINPISNRIFSYVERG